MKKWNPYIPPPNKEESPWKRAFWIALWAVLLSIVFLKNQYGVEFGIDFRFQSSPEAETSDDSRQTSALETQNFENLTVRHRDRVTQSLDVHSI